MPSKNSDHELMNPTTSEVNQTKDLKHMWDRWDEAQQLGGPGQYFKGWNLTALCVLTAGVILMAWGPASLKIISQGCIAIGALVLGVRKFQSIMQK